MKNRFLVVLLLFVPISQALAAYDGKYLGFDTADEMCEAFGQVHAIGIEMAFIEGYETMDPDLYPMFMTGEISKYNPKFLERAGTLIKKWVDVMKQSPVTYQQYQTGPKNKLREFADIVGRGTARDCKEAQ